MHFFTLQDESHIDLRILLCVYVIECNLQENVKLFQWGGSS